MAGQLPAQIGDARGHRFFGSSILNIARDPRGATAVEFAAIAPVLLVFLLGIIELGRALWTQNALHYAVEEAARCASINAVNCGTSSQIQAFAADSSGASFSSSVFTATTASCGNQVTASYPMTLNIPFLSYSFTLTAQSCYPA
jgi:Flp pilus assembly protein TadG